jgi:hypothetical protein
MAALTRIQQYEMRKSALYLERSSWIDHWREISEVMLPRNGRFLVTDRNRGGKVHNSIYDSTATKALRTLAAGLMAGMTSPARPWFRLTTTDPKMAESSDVKLWLDDVTQLMRDIFNKSNFYRALHALYEELGAFGTAATVILPDYHNVIHAHPLTVGEYAIATDARGVVNTLYREFEMTVAQLVGEFGLDNCSPQVKNLFDQGKGLDSWVRVVHAIEPRKDRNPNLRDAKNMAFMDCYYEAGRSDLGDKFLREGGFKRFNVLAPRWQTIGGDIYGSSPGQDALGDVKQLQHQQLRKGQAIDYQTKPPMQGPGNLKNNPMSMLPGGMSYFDMAGAQGGAKPLFEARLDLSHLLMDIQDVRERVKGAFYADLFMMIANDERSGITAREIAERHEEKLLMLGPVLERLHNELLGPAIDITFDRMMETGIVPPPPRELQGQDLNVQFVSVLAQAQRAVGVQSTDRLLGFVANIAATKQDPSAWDLLDTDKMTEDYGDMLGTDPQYIVPKEKVAQARDARAKQQAAMAQAAQAQQMADTAQKLGNTPTGGDNALGDLMNNFTGYSIPA